MNASIRGCACLVLTLAAVGSLSPSALAHEGHAALPSTGAQVDGNQLLLSPSAIAAVGIETETITLGTLSHKLTVNARVELPWTGKATVTTLASGKIESVLVQSGQQVAAGQELARVASMELDSLQAQLLETAAAVDVLQRLVDRQSELATDGSIAGKTARETRAQLEEKSAQYEVARRKLLALGLDDATLDEIQRSGKTISSLAVTAPISGVVEHVDARIGQLVQSTDHLFGIIDAATVYVVGEVLEADAYLVQAGLPVTIKIVGESGPELRGRIDHIRLNMDTTKRTLLVAATVDNSAGHLRPGMFGQMSIEIASIREEILCPSTAFIETDDGIFVLLREGEGKFTRRPIEIGMRTPQFAVVKSGLFPGQRVITLGTHLLEAMFETPTSATRSTSDAAESSPSQSIVAASGIVELPPRQKAFATSPMEGRLVRIDVRPGQTVAAGQVLADVDSQQLRDLELDLLQSNAKLRWHRDQVEQLRPLVDSGVSQLHEFWRRELDLKTLSEHVASLKRRLELVGVTADLVGNSDDREATETVACEALTGRIPIRASISGRVAADGPVLGQIVRAHDILFEIQDLERVWVKGFVLDRDARRVAEGDQASVTLSANPSLRTVGRVVRIAPQLESRERVLPVWIELENPGGFLREGMLARVEIRGTESPATIATHPPAAESP